MNLATLPYAFQVQSCLHNVRSLLMPRVKGHHKSQVAVIVDNQNGA